MTAVPHISGLTQNTVDVHLTPKKFHIFEIGRKLDVFRSRAGSSLSFYLGKLEALRLNFNVLFLYRAPMGPYSPSSWGPLILNLPAKGAGDAH